MLRPGSALPQDERPFDAGFDRLGPAQDERRAGRDAKGWFLPGHAALKKAGARTIGGADFRDALQADWEKHGRGCIDRMRRERPERFLEIMLAIVPRK